MEASAEAALAGILDSPTLLLQVAVLVLLALAALAIIVVNRQLTVRRLRQSERAFRELYENIGEGVFRSTLDGRMISANPYLVRLNGFADEAEMRREVTDIGREWYVDPNRRAQIHAMLLERGHVTGVVSEVRRYRTRERIWVEENIRLVRDPRTGAPLYYDGTVREVTETVRRLDLQRRYDQIAAAISGCIFQMRVYPDGRASMPYASPGLTGLFGVTPEEVVEDTAPLGAAIHPDDRPRVIQTLRQCRLAQTVWQLEFRVRHDGDERWIFGHAFPELGPDGSTLWHGFLTDVTERKRSEARIYDLAYFDSLTLLPNRARILDVLQEIQSNELLRSRWNALLFIDLDQFKLLNDSKGHLAGDRLLRELADRLRRYQERATLVGRYGGDEFVILLQFLGSDRANAEGKVRSIASAIAADLAVPFSIDGAEFATTASIGVAFFGGGDYSLDEILKQADLAMYRAKSDGAGGICFFEPDMQRQLEERLTLRRELREAFDKDELHLVYQPQVDDRWACVGAEALIRWRHPARGEVKPMVFLPLVEPSGLGAMIDAFVVRAACRTLRSWQEAPATRGLRMSVNITADQLSRPEFVAMVREALAEAGVDPSLLMLELTEHVMLEDVGAVIAAIGQLKAIGVKLALDDFGTGYSSLTYLRQLPLDVVKIDRSFVRDIDRNPDDRAIVRTVLNFAESLKLAVVAEGVETVRNLDVLRELGCHYFQGYLFARPMPLDDFIAFARLDAETRRATTLAARTLPVGEAAGIVRAEPAGIVAEPGEIGEDGAPGSG